MCNKRNHVPKKHFQDQINPYKNSEYSAEGDIISRCFFVIIRSLKDKMQAPILIC